MMPPIAPPTHATYIPYSPTFQANRTEQQQRQDQQLLSPPQTPGLASHLPQDDLRSDYIAGTATPRQSILKSEPSSPALTDNDPPGYNADIPNIDESYRLVGRRERVSFQRMDMEVQRLREKDSKLKRNIRRFRFFVRSAHLACRCVILLFPETISDLLF